MFFSPWKKCVFPEQKPFLLHPHQFLGHSLPFPTLDRDLLFNLTAVNLQLFLELALALENVVNAHKLICDC